MSRVKLCAMIASCLAFLVYPEKVASIDWWIADSLTKVRPTDPRPQDPLRIVRLQAARNEFESFQIVLRAYGEDVAEVDIELSDLKSNDGAVISSSNVSIYLEAFLNLPAPSSSEGASGLWPDPLIPRIDRYASEKRNAFPVRLTRGRNQPVWVEVFVPETATPGTYKGSATIVSDGEVVSAVPIELTVWAFRLPASSSLRSSFGLNGTNLVKAHHGKYTQDSDLYKLTRVYTIAALQHRISTHGGSMVFPRFVDRDGKVDIDWNDYDREMTPFLDGTAIPQGQPLHGARATSVELRRPTQFATEQQHVLYLKEWVNHFRSKGWLDRLFVYLWDEPTKEQHRDLFRKGTLSATAGSELRNLVTTSYSRDIAQVVHIWTPLLNCLDEKPGPDNYCHGAASPVDVYSKLAPKRTGLWFYQSCASHGCNIVGGEYFKGWPTYTIDAPGTANRVMQWLAWRMQVDGELYYSMNEAFGENSTPWTGIRLFGGNGDGTLFYPGTPDRIGGQTDIPVESIRLKLIRDGMEDYEYLVLIAKERGHAAAQEFAGRIARRAYSWERNSKTFLEIRRELGIELDRLATRRMQPGSNE